MSEVRNVDGNINSTREVIPSITTQYLNGHSATMVTAISIPAIITTLQNNSIFSTTDYLIGIVLHQVI
jgi:two-component system response regulator YesN